MDVELVKCECCGLKEDCTTEYIDAIKAKSDGKWLCGLCSEAVREEVSRDHSKYSLEDAVRAHMSFCRNYKSSPASRVADGMRLMLRRRSSDLCSSSSSTTTTTKKYYVRSASDSQVGDVSGLCRY